MITRDEFKKQITALAYRCAKTGINPKEDSFSYALKEWYLDFKDLDLEDLQAAVKSHRTVYFPDMGELEEKAREYGRLRRVDESRKAESFRVISSKTQAKITSGILREIIKDAFNVLRSGVTVELWRAMANKYRDVKNPDFHPNNNPYRTFGEFYDRAADDLAAQ